MGTDFGTSEATLRVGAGKQVRLHVSFDEHAALGVGAPMVVRFVQ